MSVELRSFRSYERVEAELSPALTVLAGPNGVGKTNLLEAIAMLLLGQSPRTSADQRCIRDGSTFLRVAGRVRRGDSTTSRAVTVDHAAGRRLMEDGSPSRSLGEFAGRFPMVVFLPERLLVVRGAPARRRGTLDRFVTRTYPSTAPLLRDYGSALQQRNALLRRAKAGARISELIAPWDDRVAELGVAVRRERGQLMDRLSPSFTTRFEQLTGFDDGAITIVQRGEDLPASLVEHRAAEIRRGSTLSGPHLDDVVLCQGARDLRLRGSTGEQRAALLAWALAEHDVLSTLTGTAPILLLDEPFAELDPSRRQRLAGTLAAAGQVLVTATEPPAELAASVARSTDVRAVVSGGVLPWKTPISPPATSST